MHRRLAAVLVSDIQARLIRVACQSQSLSVYDQIRTIILLTERVAPVPVNDNGFMDVPRRDKGRFHSFDQVFPIFRRKFPLFDRAVEKNGVFALIDLIKNL